MSEIAATGHRATAVGVAHESYAFACMRCGHGWEESYDIEHHVDAKGQEFVTYLAHGSRVPSPLTRPTCLNCGGHVVRIMRAGQVSSVRSALDSLHQRRPAQPPQSVAGPPGAADPAGTVPDPASATAPADGAAARPAHHHWHLSDLLHPFRRAG
ncbi:MULTISPECIES: hypothetical protein [Streptomyces]|uniref:C2H2-type domain-containing protein n=2 Tax=Streptomyces TaxID=1883 RepID=A0A0W7X9U8_9ACTN|nr:MULTISPECIES: hypothetical protein [Streptomyces]KUF19546.1 hypothetical protein AT728_03985 [Streptomyces silvensis]MVO85968.1 hypothetical protein [Streptomyces typhae]